MTDTATVIDTPATDTSAPQDTRSTVLDTNAAPAASGGGIAPDPEKSEPSLRDTLEAALKEQEAPPKEKPAGEKAQEKPDAKAEKTQPEKPDEVQAQRARDGKPGAPEKAADEANAGDPNAQAHAEHDDDEAAPRINPPARLLPDAKERWTNTPRAVQRDIDTMVREYEGEIQRERQANERYETLRPFDELARNNGRDLVQSLAKINQIENMMKANLPAALNAILQEIGPRKADGSPVNLFELASAVVQQGPDGYRTAIAHGNQQQQMAQRSAETEALRRENETLRAQQRASQVEAQIVAPFRAAHPRYDELQGDVAFFLNSGKISQGLSPADRLEAAYAMAERLNPSSSPKVAPPGAGPDHDARVEPDSSGNKSIKSAPGVVSEMEEAQAQGSIRDLLSRNLNKLSRAG